MKKGMKTLLFCRFKKYRKLRMKKRLSHQMVINIFGFALYRV